MYDEYLIKTCMYILKIELLIMILKFTFSIFGKNRIKIVVNVISLLIFYFFCLLYINIDNFPFSVLFIIFVILFYLSIEIIHKFVSNETTYT